MVKQIGAREATRESLPPLRVSQFHTTSSAVERLSYRGGLHDWSNFCRDVRNTTDSQNWSNAAIKYSLASRNLEENEVFVGDESGVQGRFQQAVGQILGMVFRAQTLDIRFADFKCLGKATTITPDCVIKNSGNDLQVVGELKVPWVDDHSIQHSRDAGQPFDLGSHLRMLLAQPVQYMKDLKCKYGFLSTYEETIFLQQRHNSARWVIDCSPVIFASDAYTEWNPVNTSSTVSLRECFFHIATLALPEGEINNQQPRSEWVDSLQQEDDGN